MTQDITWKWCTGALSRTVTLGTVNTADIDRRGMKHQRREKESGISSGWKLNCAEDLFSPSQSWLTKDKTEDEYHFAIFFSTRDNVSSFLFHAFNWNSGYFHTAPLNLAPNIMQLHQLSPAVFGNLCCDLHEKTLEHESAKCSKPKLQHDFHFFFLFFFKIYVYLSILNSPASDPWSCPCLFLDALTADYAVVLPSGC